MHVCMYAAVAERRANNAEYFHGQSSTYRRQKPQRRSLALRSTARSRWVSTVGVLSTNPSMHKVAKMVTWNIGVRRHTGLTVVFNFDVRAIWLGQYGAEPHYSTLPFWQLCALKASSLLDTTVYRSFTMVIRTCKFDVRR